MPRSDEAAAFFHAVYCAVQEIPHGKVTSYGHIAKLVGTRKSPISSFHIIEINKKLADNEKRNVPAR